LLSALFLTSEQRWLYSVAIHALACAEFWLVLEALKKIVSPRRAIGRDSITSESDLQAAVTDKAAGGGGDRTLGWRGGPVHRRGRIRAVRHYPNYTACTGLHQCPLSPEQRTVSGNYYRQAESVPTHPPTRPLPIPTQVRDAPVLLL